MPNRHTHGAVLPEADDLQRIHGIGPGVESRLRTRGVTTFAQLAALTPAELMGLLSDLAGLSSERIVKQDWIGQARELMPDPPPAEPADLQARQHYATFTLELLLDAGRAVRRTRLMHVQSEAEELWAGWDAARLIELIAERAALQPAEPVPAAPPPGEADEPFEQTLDLPDATPAAPQPGAPLAGLARIRQLELRASGAQLPHQLLRHDTRFSALLTLELSGLAPDAPIGYTAAIHARPIGGARHQIGAAHGTLAAAERVTISVAELALAPGTYRPEALVMLYPAGAPGGRGITALLEGGLIQVY